MFVPDILIEKLDLKNLEEKNDEEIGATLKYDLGTQIFLNSLANRIQQTLVDKASVLCKYEDPRPQPVTQLAAQLLPQP